MSPDPTIYEVAKRAQVSISTVSLAINHPDRVREATRQRIFDVADELAFVPKERAVLRARTGLGRIAAVGPFSSYPSYLRRLAGALEELGDSDTQLLVYDYEDIAVTGSTLLSSLPLRGHVDGLIVMGVQIDEKIAQRLRTRLPTVLLEVTHPGLPSVVVDDIGAAASVGSYLAGRGHEDVVFFGEFEATMVVASPVDRRLRGLQSGLGGARVHEISVGRGADGARVAVDEMLQSPASARATAIFAYRDFVAIRILGELRRRGIAVPEAMELIGYDDDPVAAAIGLSTVTHPFEESGRAAVRLLQGMVSGEVPQPADVALPFALSLRETTVQK